MAKVHDLVKDACKKGEAAILLDVISNKDEILEQDSNGNTPLMIAASVGSLPIIKFIDDRADELLGYDIYKIFSIRDKKGLSVLSIAAKNNNTAAVVYLYELGGYDSFTANRTDWEAYANMQINPNEDKNGIAKRLQLDAKTKLNAIYKKDLYEIVIDHNSTQKSIRDAISHFDSVDYPIYDEQPALYHAVVNQNVSAMKVLLDMGAKVKPEMLPIALDSKNEEIIELVGANIPQNIQAIEWGALLDIFFDHAIRKNNVAIIDRLIANMTMTKLQEALIYSAELGCNSALNYLLEHGVDVNSKENDHRARTALMMAAKKGNTETLKILLAHGANIHLRSERKLGLTALEYAKVYRHKECVQILQQAYVIEQYGDNPLVHAATTADLSGVLSHARDEKHLVMAINIAKATKQPKQFIRELKKKLRLATPRTHIFPFSKIFKK